MQMRRWRAFGDSTTSESPRRPCDNGIALRALWHRDHADSWTYQPNGDANAVSSTGRVDKQLSAKDGALLSDDLLQTRLGATFADGQLKGVSLPGGNAVADRHHDIQPTVARVEALAGHASRANIVFPALQEQHGTS